MRRSETYDGRRYVLLTTAELDRFDPTGYWIKDYDPTLHCDNKCLRAGRCLGGGCTKEFELTEMRCRCGESLIGVGGHMCLRCRAGTRSSPFPPWGGKDLVFLESTPS